MDSKSKLHVSWRVDVVAGYRYCKMCLNACNLHTRVACGHYEDRSCNLWSFVLFGVQADPTCMSRCALLFWRIFEDNNLNAMAAMIAYVWKLRMFYNHNLNKCASTGLTTYFPQGSTFMFTMAQVVGNHQQTTQQEHPTSPSKNHPNPIKTALNTTVKQQKRCQMVLHHTSETHFKHFKSFHSPWKFQKAPKEENWRKACRSSPPVMAD